MTTDNLEHILTALTDGSLYGSEWETWLAQHPTEAEEIEIARRARALIAELRHSNITLSADFEARLLARIQADRTILDLLDLGLAGLGSALLELLNTLFGIAPSTRLAVV